MNVYLDRLGDNHLFLMTSFLFNVWCIAVNEMNVALPELFHLKYIEKLLGWCWTNCLVSMANWRVFVLTLEPVRSLWCISQISVVYCHSCSSFSPNTFPLTAGNRFRKLIILVYICNWRDNPKYVIPHGNLKDYASAYIKRRLFLPS